MIMNKIFTCDDDAKEHFNFSLAIIIDWDKSFISQISLSTISTCRIQKSRIISKISHLIIRRLHAYLRSGFMNLLRKNVHTQAHRIFHIFRKIMLNRVRLLSSWGVLINLSKIA